MSRALRNPEVRWFAFAVLVTLGSLTAAFLLQAAQSPGGAAEVRAATSVPGPFTFTTPLQLPKPPPQPTGSAPFVLLLGEGDVPEAGLVQTLVQAQRISGADVVTCGAHLETDGRPALHFFSGEPGGLGLLANDYGRVALVRRSLLATAAPTRPSDEDAIWPILAALSASDAQFVSIPAPLVTSSEPSAVGEDSTDALGVAQELERALPYAARSAARLAAGLAASSASAPAGRRWWPR